MIDFFSFKEILDNQASRGMKEYGEADYIEDSTTYANRKVIKIANKNILFFFTLDGRFLGIKNLTRGDSWVLRI